MSLLHVPTVFTDLLCLRRPLRVLLAFFWYMLFIAPLHITTMNNWKRRTSRFVGTTLLQLAMLFGAPHTTYAIVIPALNRGQWHTLLDDKVYIGFTTKSVHSRQDARIRNLGLLQEGQFTNTEVMVHYFHTRSDFFLALILPLQTFDSKAAVRTAECLLIHQWKPQLNMPWIARLNPTSATRRSLELLHMRPLGVDSGFEYVDDFVHWALFAYIVHSVFLPKKDGPYWLLCHKMV